MIRRFRNIIEHNLPTKILALVIAVVLWGYVMNDQNPTIEGSYTVPLTVENQPDGYKVSQDVMTVKIKVRGPRSLFVSASRDDFKAYVDLKQAEEGQQSCRVQTVLPYGFELIETNPDTVTVTLDRIIQKKMKAELIVSGSAPPGVAVGHITQDTEYVTLEGPASAIAEVSRVIGYVGLANNNSDFSLQVPLTAINTDGREVQGVRIVPSSLQVDVQLARGLTRKVVSVQPVIGSGLDKGYEIANVKVDPSKIEIAGSAEAIKNITTVNTKAVDLSGITKTTDKSVSLDLPDGVTVTTRDVSVHIEVRIKPESGTGITGKK